MEPELDIFDAIDRAALKKRGTLRAWMIENRAAFEERLLTRKPDWPTLAAVFASAGLLDSRGKPPTSEAARKTWQRVKGPVRPRAGPTKTATEPAMAPVKSTPPIRPRPPTTPDRSSLDRPDEDEGVPAFVEPRHRFIGKPAIDRARLPKKE